MSWGSGARSRRSAWWTLPALCIMALVVVVLAPIGAPAAMAGPAAKPTA